MKFYLGNIFVAHFYALYFSANNCKGYYVYIFLNPFLSGLLRIDSASLRRPLVLYTNWQLYPHYMYKQNQVFVKKLSPLYYDNRLMQNGEIAGVGNVAKHICFMME